MFRIIVVLTFFLGCSAQGWAECGTGATIGTSGLTKFSPVAPQNSHSSVIEVGASRVLVLEIENRSNSGAGLYSVIAYPKGGSRLRPYCISSGGLAPSGSSSINVTEVPFSDDVEFEVADVGPSSLSFTFYSDLNPKKIFPTKDVVRRNLYVYIFDNAPLVAKAREYVDKAVAIWRGAGVDFKPVYKTVSGSDVVKVLGADKLLTSFLGDSDADQGEWEDRQRAQALKPDPNSFAVMFVRTTFMGFGGTRADAGRGQVYIDEDVPGASPGRTVAHELGHLLLGVGHSGHPGVTWTSGLMIAGTSSDASDITDKDAQTARLRARQIPLP